MTIDASEIERRFDYAGEPDQVRKIAHVALRLAMKRTAELVIGETPAGREQSLALTKLEEALMWANAAIARPEQDTKSA